MCQFSPFEKLQKYPRANCFLFFTCAFEERIHAIMTNDEINLTPVSDFERVLVSLKFIVTFTQEPNVRVFRQTLAPSSTKCKNSQIVDALIIKSQRTVSSALLRPFDFDNSPIFTLLVIGIYDCRKYPKTPLRYYVICGL